MREQCDVNGSDRGHLTGAIFELFSKPPAPTCSASFTYLLWTLGAASIRCNKNAIAHAAKKGGWT